MAGQGGNAVRRGRSTRASGRIVAVTGAAGGVGRVVATHLRSNPTVRRVVAVDSRRGDLDGVQWRVLDIAAGPPDGGLAARLAACDAVVHCATWGDPDHPPPLRRRSILAGTAAVLAAAGSVGARRVVLLSSATVYGALPGAPVPLDEDAPLLAPSDDSLIGDLLELEGLAAREAAVGRIPPLTVVRPALTVGAGVDGPLGRHFDGPRLLVVKGCRPLWQYCHVDDLARALVTAVLADLDGPLTVACEGWLTLEEVEEIGGFSRVELPAALALGTADRLHRLGLTRAPVSELAYAMHPWVVPATRLRAAGWRPTHDNVSALQALLIEAAARRVNVSRSRETTLGAAGATVALLGTAAVVRRRRRRR